MKIPSSIKSLYESQFENQRNLQAFVDEQLRPIATEKDWLYLSRIKGLESFTLKLESGRFNRTTNLEDFFGCSLVIKNENEIDECKSKIEEFFIIKYQRPNSLLEMKKRSDSFPFDDLRLYVTLKPDKALSPKNEILLGLIFEIQIKTFLQHAWCISTHDLIYKTDLINWNKERIAYQVKALLENAETSIKHADLIAQTVHQRISIEIKTLNELINVFKEIFDPDLLPKDLRRLAQNALTLTKSINLELQTFITLMKENKVLLNKKNLTPFASIVSLCIQCNKVGHNEKDKNIYYIPEEIEDIDVLYNHKSFHIIRK